MNNIIGIILLGHVFFAIVFLYFMIIVSLIFAAAINIKESRSIVLKRKFLLN